MLQYEMTGSHRVAVEVYVNRWTRTKRKALHKSRGLLQMRQLKHQRRQSAFSGPPHGSFFSWVFSWDILYRSQKELYWKVQVATLLSRQADFVQEAWPEAVFLCPRVYRNEEPPKGPCCRSLDDYRWYGPSCLLWLYLENHLGTNFRS